ncbi:choline monooxygenase [Ekhidna lutea]|uniref:Choline monooxygenase n=1 Tax=Ekhidna lutea TaxID=447679 RepID=A0A239JFW3_EKHLU|nr:aromatic ring-hydroxylating dioxygenase subunit alpha [Ekhidna lutea]SNT04173.1 choline monooxygenase [Ekhidna lutea]
MSTPSQYRVNSAIDSAETLPASFYNDQQTFDLLKEKVFYASWQYVGDKTLVKLNEEVYPFILMDGYLTEPLLLTRDEQGEIHCLSNVCTHRANLVAENPAKTKRLQCRYHGRKFALNGKFQSMPEFKQAKDFPRPCDDLHKFLTAEWGPLLFAKLGGEIDFSRMLDEMNQKVGFIPSDELVYSDALSKEYLVNAHWALYCDNYLEGFHIPFVHEDLNQVLDYSTYEVQVEDHYVLQVGYGDEASDCFDLPEGHPDEGKMIAAYYYWIYPNLMLNFYPWGLSVNIVRPLSMNQTKVSFRTYILDESKLHSGAGALLDKVEREDEAVVESVHKGLKSKYYPGGRFSPSREQGVHYFHQLLAASLNK